MSELIRESVWTFIGVMIALMTLLVTIFLFLIQRRRKSLSFEVITNTDLLTINEQVKGRVKILIDGLVVKDLKLLIMRVLNDGNVPIASQDFERPLCFFFGKDSEIISAELIHVQPSSLKPEIVFEPKQITFQPSVINSGDSIMLKIFLSSYDGTIDVDARIFGIKEVKRILGDNTRLGKIGTLLTLGGMFGLFLVFVVKGLLKESLTSGLAAALFISAFIFFTIGYALVLIESSKRKTVLMVANKK